MKTTPRLSIVAAMLISSLAATTVFAADAPTMKMTTDIPPEITTPDSVETSIGTLKFLDGAPYPETAKKAYDYLDTMRGVDAFLLQLSGDLLVGAGSAISVDARGHLAGTGAGAGPAGADRIGGGGGGHGGYGGRGTGSFGAGSTPA